MTYQYRTLDPRPTPEAREHNDAIFGTPDTGGGPVYGIEVTVPALAVRCAANLDPQHLGGDARTTAIEAAVAWPPPPPGSLLATVRADADSVGAMAVLTLRAMEMTGQRIIEDIAAEEGRIAQIAEADREASGPWPGERPAAEAEDLVGPVTAISAVAADHALSLDERVSRMCRWIVAGACPDLERYHEQALAEAHQALESLEVDYLTGGDYVIVTGAPRLAIGYRIAPVVVATNPAFRWQGGEPHRKHTVARWNSDVPMYWDSMLDALRRLEPGWGGSSSIVGSPQGVGSVLSTDQVADLADRYQQLAQAEERIVAAGRVWVDTHPTSWDDFDRRSGQPLTDAGWALDSALEKADGPDFGMSGSAYGTILRRVLGPVPVEA